MSDCCLGRLPTVPLILLWPDELRDLWSLPLFALCRSALYMAAEEVFEADFWAAR